MKNLMAYALLGGTLWLAAACSESVSTEPVRMLSKTGSADVTALAAPAPTASCVYSANNSTGTLTYDVVIDWSGLSVTEIDLYTPAGPDGHHLIVQATLGHPTRKGPFSVNVSSAPGTAELLGRTGGLGIRQLCVDGSL